MLEYLSQLDGWTWFIIAAVLFILEAVVPGVFLIWFGVAAGIAGVAAVGLGVAFPWQLLIFAVSAAITVVVTRRFYGGDRSGEAASNLNARAQQYVGRTFVLSEGISNGRGRMKVGDTIWTVEGPELPTGASVRVTGAAGTVLIVEAADGVSADDLPKAGTFG